MSLWHRCAESFHQASATGSRARLHSCRSGAHRWDDEKLPTEHPLTSQPQTPPWAHISPFCVRSQRREWGGEGGWVPCNLWASSCGGSRRLPVAAKMFETAHTRLVYPGSGAGPSTSGRVSNGAVEDKGGGLWITGQVCQHSIASERSTQTGGDGPPLQA